jgi:carbamoyltransferase
MTDWILGLCDGHDSGVALVDERGALVWAVSEERLSRRKHQAGFPHRALRAALEVAPPGRIKAVGVAEVAGRAPFRVLDTWYRGLSPAGPLGLRSRVGAAYSRTVARRLAGPESRVSRAVLRRRLDAAGLSGVPLILLDHHECHAWSAAAGADDALVVTMDAFGDGVSGSVSRLRGGASPAPALAVQRRFPAPHGAALVYGAVTELLGFAEGDEGKVVARAAAGDPERLRPHFARALQVREGAPILAGPGALARLTRALAGEPEDDVAAALQAHVERVTVAVVRDALARFGGERLRLAGGLFANVALNRRMAEAAEAAGVRDTFVFPAMGDAGLCAGAAWALAARSGHVLGLADARIGVPASGPGGATGSEGLGRPGGAPVTRCVDEVRAALLAGAVVARCAGAMEFGPRALGARSFLFRAHDPAVGAALNRRLGRDPRMPFGPVIPASVAPRMLRGAGAAVAPMTRFMTVALPASDHMRAVAPAAVHADGTARAQILHPEDDPALHAMLLAMPEKLLVNTSLNLHGEPIVATTDQAAHSAAQAGAACVWTS